MIITLQGAEKILDMNESGELQDRLAKIEVIFNQLPPNRYNIFSNNTGNCTVNKFNVMFQLMPLTPQITKILQYVCN